MDIKLDAYRIFYAAAGKQSFSKAAQELFITQSAVSQSIKNLEERLKTVLFVRSKREIRLTPEGETLYEYVKNALSLIEKGESELLRFQTLEQGQLRIAAYRRSLWAAASSARLLKLLFRSVRCRNIL